MLQRTLFSVILFLIIIKGKSQDSFSEYIKEDSLKFFSLIDSIERPLIIDKNFIMQTEDIVYKRGNLFNNGKQYAYARYTGNEQFVGIIIKEINSEGFDFLYYKWEGMDYQRDTIININTDSIYEYIRTWNPLSACCISNNDDIYVLNKQNRFNKVFSLLNPTYFPCRNEVITMSYCYQGECQLTFMTYNNFVLDTIMTLNTIAEKENQYLLQDHKKSKKETVKNIPELFLETKNEYLNWFCKNQKE
jgi:hypothetical protein